MVIPAHISTFDALVTWLVTERHGGSPYRMAKALKVSPSLPFHWQAGLVKRPGDTTLARLCEVYDLDADAVRAIVFSLPLPRRRLTPIGGGSHGDATPLADWAHVILRLIGAFFRSWMVRARRLQPLGV